MNAAADEDPAPPAPATATATDNAADDTPAPPELLPWGAEPEAVKTAPPGATSATVAATGADIAAATTADSKVPVPEFGPKGYTSRARTLRSTKTNVAPQPPAKLAEPVPGKRDVKFHYAGGSQFADTDGTYANLVIGKPYLADNDYHTLAEIAVQSADAKQIVEVGWTVDRNVNGDSDPHLFVYHWVDGDTSCYNGCGWKQYSKTVVAGGTLPTGTSKRFGIQHSPGAWWVAYDSEWIGYFPDTLWDGDYTRAGLVQWFGEVASSTTSPCTDMGTGRGSGDDAASRFGTIALVNSPSDPVAATKASGPEKDPVYSVTSLSDRTFRYGGPGAC